MSSHATGAAEIQQCGIYFLLKEEDVVYVGQSVNAAGRILTHLKEGKDFDRVLFWPQRRSRLDDVEKRLIRLLQPPLNHAHRGRTEQAV